MNILAIETSCDDTGIAVLKIKGNNPPVFNVLSNIIASQTEVHKKYGGVYPMMAKREHEKNLQPSLETALNQAKVSKRDIDLVAVTNGPGLEPCLWAGVNFAKDLAKKWDVPLVSVNHIEAHILVNILEHPNIQFPAVALIVSGGHTQLILVKGIGKYEILGETRDDAAGECFDKCARILGLSYPGGPIISKLAGKNVGCSTSHKLPRPMINTKDYDFSFSGLKTAVLYHHRKQNEKTQKSKRYIADMCAEIQQAIIDVLIKKTIKAVKDYNAKTIILGGGVSANVELRKQFKEAIENKPVDFLVPPANLSTDNAAMIAIAGYFHQKDKVSIDIGSRTISANGNLRIGQKMII